MRLCLQLALIGEIIALKIAGPLCRVRNINLSGSNKIIFLRYNFIEKIQK